MNDDSQPPWHARLRSQEEYDQWLEMETARLDREHNVIHSMAPLIGWEIIMLERWKKGVIRFSARRVIGNMAEFQMGFARDECFAQLQIPK